MFVDVLISFEEFREYGSKRLGLGRAACLRVDAFIVDVSSRIVFVALAEFLLCEP